VRTKGTEKAGKDSMHPNGEVVMFNIRSISTDACVVAVKNNFAKLRMIASACTSKGEKVALSFRTDGARSRICERRVMVCGRAESS
jgi:translation initiation factor 2 gamma subunit (eIF-2gamma)